MFLHALFHVFHHKSLLQKLFQIILFLSCLWNFFLSISFWFGCTREVQLYMKKITDTLEASFNTLWYVRVSEVFCLEIGWYRKLLLLFSTFFFYLLQLLIISSPSLMLYLAFLLSNLLTITTIFFPKFLIMFASTLSFCDKNYSVHFLRWSSICLDFLLSNSLLKP